MSSGIGGKTVQEAKANMSYRESRNWLYFFKEKGSTSSAVQTQALMDKIDFVGAKICWAVMIAAGNKKATIEMFLPERLNPNKAKVPDENAPVADIKTVFNFLKSVSKG